MKLWPMCIISCLITSLHLGASERLSLQETCPEIVNESIKEAYRGKSALTPFIRSFNKNFPTPVSTCKSIKPKLTNQIKSNSCVDSLHMLKQTKRRDRLFISYYSKLFYNTQLDKMIFLRDRLYEQSLDIENQLNHNILCEDNLLFNQCESFKNDAKDIDLNKLIKTRAKNLTNALIIKKELKNKDSEVTKEVIKELETIFPNINSKTYKQAISDYSISELEDEKLSLDLYEDYLFESKKEVLEVLKKVRDSISCLNGENDHCKHFDEIQYYISTMPSDSFIKNSQDLSFYDCIEGQRLSLRKFESIVGDAVKQSILGVTFLKAYRILHRKFSNRPNLIYQKKHQYPLAALMGFELSTSAKIIKKHYRECKKNNRNFSSNYYLNSIQFSQCNKELTIGILLSLPTALDFYRYTKQVKPRLRFTVTNPLNKQKVGQNKEFTDKFKSDMFRLMKNVEKSGITKELVQESNRLTKELKGKLENIGIKSTLIENDRLKGVYDIKLTGFVKGANRHVKAYFKAAEKFGANSLTISLAENFNASTLGFFSPVSMRVEVGPNAVLNLLKNQRDPTALHELRHLYRTTLGKNEMTKFSFRFYGSLKKNLYGKDNMFQDFYGYYMWADEVYAHSSDLRTLASKYLKSPTKKLLDHIHNKLYSVSHLAENSLELSKSFLKSKKIHINKFYHIELKDSFGRISTIRLTDKQIEIFKNPSLDKITKDLDIATKLKVKDRYHFEVYGTDPKETLRKIYKEEVIFPKVYKLLSDLKDVSQLQVLKSKKVLDNFDRLKKSPSDLAMELHLLTKNVR